MNLEKIMNQEFIELIESTWLDYVKLVNKLYELVDNHQSTMNVQNH